MSEYSYVAPCLMGVEGLVADELRAQDLQNVRSENGRVFFTGDESAMARANLWSRCAERILLHLGSFPARTFEELFQGVKNLPLEEWNREERCVSGDGQQPEQPTAFGAGLPEDYQKSGGRAAEADLPGLLV